MNKAEAITLCGDVLTEIDVLRGSLFPGIPARKKLDEYREIIDRKQLELVDLAFAENTQQYKTVTTELEAINKEVKGAIHDTDHIAQNFETLEKFVTTLDRMLMIAVSIA